jgi:uncharacterized protein YecE (DUF72 family)
VRSYIGCSGFHYKEWKGVFYPEKLPQRKWFEYYSEQFNTLELNVTFYRFPQKTFLQNWYKTSPDHFVFAVKVPRLITHYKQFRDTESMLGDFYNTIREGLLDKLGPVLFQLPPQAAFTADNLQRIIQQVDSSFMNVIEFRHPSWWNKEVFDILTAHNISFCSISYPGLPDEVIMNNHLVYYRFHGVPQLYKSEYEKKQLRKVAETISENEKVKEAYIYFNNTASGAAINNALYLKNYFEKKNRPVAKII